MSDHSSPTTPSSPQSQDEQPATPPERAPQQGEAAADAKKQHGKKASASARPKNGGTDTTLKEPPPVRVNHEVRGMLLTIRAETKMSFLDIIKHALRAWGEKLAFARPMYFRRLSRESLRIMTGLAADVENAIHKSIRKIMKTRIDPALKIEAVEELHNESSEWKKLRQIMSKEAGIPITPDITTDINLAIGALIEKKEESNHKSVQNSYDNVIQILERYRLETFDAPENPEDYE